MRLSREQADTIRRLARELAGDLARASFLQGRTMTDFVVAAVQDAAQRAIEQV
jgi:uncharacterized protein (DUF1778 family)